MSDLAERAYENMIGQGSWTFLSKKKKKKWETFTIYLLDALKHHQDSDMTLQLMANVQKEREVLALRDKAEEFENLFGYYSSVLIPLFKGSGKFAHLCKVSESPIEGVPRLAEAYEQLFSKYNKLTEKPNE